MTPINGYGDYVKSFDIHTNLNDINIMRDNHYACVGHTTLVSNTVCCVFYIRVLVFSD